MLLCVLFYICRSALLSVCVYLVNLIPGCVQEALTSVAPEFTLLFLYTRILYVYSGLLKKCVCTP